MPAWRVFLPLGVVVLALLALVVVPPMFTNYTTALRQELSGVLNPLNSAVGSLDRTTGAELAAARGFAVTGDPFFVDQFLLAHEYGNGVAARIDSLALYADESIRRQVSYMVQIRNSWAESHFGRTRTDFIEGLAEQQAHFDAMMSAAQGVREALSEEIERHLQRIARAERMRTTLTFILGLVALLAAAAALWLAHRLRKSERHVLRRAREEAALRRIAQTMAEAEDLSGALRRIVGAVAHIGAADRVYIQQVNYESNRTEVIASTGEKAPEVGLKSPYSGSQVEWVLFAAAEGSLVGAKTDEECGRHLIVPLVSEGETLGALTLERNKSRPVFDVSEERRTRLLADMAALVLRRLQLIEEIRQKEAALQKTAHELQILNDTLELRVRDRTRTIRELSSALTLAEQSERSELAQFIHDDLQQLLFALQLNLKVMETSVQNLPVDEIQQQLRTIRESADMAILSTRRLTMDLSPPVDKERFIDTLNWLARHSLERFGLNVEIESADELYVPSGDVRILLCRIVRELLFNVVKHAQTTNASISALKQNGQLILEVTDDGIGFDPSTVQDRTTIGGFGLRRASERLELLGGNINITSEKGGGTRSRIVVPL